MAVNFEIGFAGADTETALRHVGKRLVPGCVTTDKVDGFGRTIHLDRFLVHGVFVLLREKVGAILDPFEVALGQESWDLTKRVAGLFTSKPPKDVPQSCLQHPPALLWDGQVGRGRLGLEAQLGRDADA
ncbi:hypothetical protein PG985_011164 [Apiospora marii]|uniref:uncharacterized protein n=1 Tax=Apiospora marii TaxID=335849 RepID=UPI003130B8DB